jgi:hypothetical protein
MAKVRRFLGVVVLMAAGGCVLPVEGDDDQRRAPANSDIEVKQGALGCGHSPCQTGGFLTSGCGFDDCVAWICGVDPYCCAIAWDSTCVAEVGSVCQRRCDCGTICVQGNPFYPDACDCTADIYGVDPYCSQTYWDSVCVGEVGSVCGTPCP